jgi:hypothetical protein
MLEPLPYDEWKATKTTLHLMCQIVGKIRLRHVPHKSHWWNVTLHPTARGLSTLRMRAGETFFEIAFDFVDHRVIVSTDSAHAPATIELRDGLSVSEFYRTLFSILREFGLDISIVATPYGMGVETPFASDTEHASYDATMVRRWWRAVLWTSNVFDRYASEFNGKQSPAHLFWHSFDLALARFSGRPAGGPPKSDRVQQEAYSHEVIAVGFWAGDETTPFPAYYTYTAPEPNTLATMPLAPEGADWIASGAGHIGRLAYDVVRESANPSATLLSFLRSGFEAGARAAAWNAEALFAR